MSWLWYKASNSAAMQTQTEQIELIFYLNEFIGLYVWDPLSDVTWPLWHIIGQPESALLKASLITTSLCSATWKMLCLYKLILFVQINSIMLARGCSRRNARQLTTSIERTEVFKALTYLRSTNRLYSTEPRSKKGNMLVSYVQLFLSFWIGLVEISPH